MLKTKDALTSNDCEGTRGPFYTIGRFSFLAADTLRKQHKEKKRDS